MANGMAGTSPSTGGPLRAGRNINPQTGQVYKNTIADLRAMQRGGTQLNEMQLNRLQNAPEYKNTMGDLRAMQRSGQELNAMQLNRLENAPGQGNLERVSPGVYRNPQGQLVNPQGQVMPQQPQMSQQGGMMQQPQQYQTLPFMYPPGTFPGLQNTGLFQQGGLAQGVGAGIGNWLGGNSQQVMRPAVMPSYTGMNGMFPYNK